MKYTTISAFWDDLEKTVLDDCTEYEVEVARIGFKAGIAAYLKATQNISDLHELGSPASEILYNALLNEVVTLIIEDYTKVNENA